MKRTLIGAVLVGCWGAAAARGDGNVGFPMFGFNPQRTSFVPGKGCPQPVLKWTYRLPGAGQWIPAGGMVSPSAVYATITNHVVKLDRGTGKELAKARVEGGEIVHRATSLAEERVVLLTSKPGRDGGDGGVVCLDAGDLTVRWKVDSLGAAPVRLLVVDGVAIAEGQAGGKLLIKAFALADGNGVWDRTIDLPEKGSSPGWASPAEKGVMIVRTFGGARDDGPGRLIALETKTGKEVWAVEVNVRSSWGHAHSYAIAGGRLYCNNLAARSEDKSGGGAIIDLADGKVLKWCRIFNGDGAVTVGGEYFYSGGKGWGGVSAAPISGEGKDWAWNCGSYTHNKATLADGVVYLSDWRRRRWAVAATEPRTVNCFKPFSPRGYALHAEGQLNVVCDGQQFLFRPEMLVWNWKGERPAYVTCYEDLGVGEDGERLAAIATDDKDPSRRAGALRALTAFDAPRQLELATKLLGDADPAVRLEAAWTLYAQASPAAFGSESPWGSIKALAQRAKWDHAKVLAAKDAIFAAIRPRLEASDGDDLDQMREYMVLTLDLLKGDEKIAAYVAGLAGKTFKAADPRDSLAGRAVQAATRPPKAR